MAPIVRLNEVGTFAFVVSAVVSAVLFTPGVRVAGVAVALVLFAVGIWAFLWGYWSAVQRSRADQIAVSQLYFFSGEVVPRPVKRRMMLLLAVQVVVGLATALARPSTDGSPGSTLAFGILVPVFGLGLNGLLAAHHGQFLPRTDGDVPPPGSDLGQNAPHG